jgi:xanthine/uracil/vitamin C permease (AzgA family)
VDIRTLLVSSTSSEVLGAVGGGVGCWWGSIVVSGASVISRESGGTAVTSSRLSSGCVGCRETDTLYTAGPNMQVHYTYIL